MRNLRYGLQEKSAHRFNTLVDILSKIARKVSKTRKFKLNQQALCITNCAQAPVKAPARHPDTNRNGCIRSARHDCKLTQQKLADDCHAVIKTIQIIEK